MKKISEHMKEYRRNLHKIPELGYVEKKTQAYLLQEIKKMGYEPKIICKTGIYIYLDCGSKETYGFRTEIIVAALRNPKQIKDAAFAGADIVTCGLAVYQDAMNNPYTTYGLDVFRNAWDETAKE